MFEDEDDLDESPEKLNELQRDAVKRYEEMIRNRDNFFFDADTLNAIADFYIDHDELNKALDVTRYASKLHPSVSWFMLREANVLSRLMLHQQALDKLKIYEIINPNDPDYFIIKGHVYGNMSNPEKALECFLNAMHLADDRDSLLHDIAYVYSDLEDFNLAIDYMRKYILTGIDDLICYDQLIFWLKETDRLQEGAEFFNHLIDKNPYSANAWLSLGTVNKELTNYADALHALDYALVIEPTNVHAWLEQGDVYFLMKEYLQAIDSYLHAMEFSPSNAVTLYNIGECYEHLNHLDTARDFYTKAIRIQPEMPEAWYSIGMLLLYREKWYDAMHYFRKSIELDSKNAEYWFALGDCEASLNHLQEARECYENVVELEPSNEDIWIEYSMLLFDNNQIPEAIDVIQDGIKNHPDNAEYYYHLVSYLYAHGLLKESYAELEIALEKNFELHDMLFDIHFDLRNDSVVQRMIAYHEHRNH